MDQKGRPGQAARVLLSILINRNRYVMRFLLFITIPDPAVLIFFFRWRLRFFAHEALFASMFIKGLFAAQNFQNAVADIFSSSAFFRRPGIEIHCNDTSSSVGNFLNTNTHFVVCDSFAHSGTTHEDFGLTSGIDLFEAL